MRSALNMPRRSPPVPAPANRYTARFAGIFLMISIKMVFHRDSPEPRPNAEFSVLASVHSLKERVAIMFDSVSSNSAALVTW